MDKNDVILSGTHDSTAINKSLDEVTNATGSWEDSSNSEYLRHNLFWTITIILAYTTIFIIGFFGNLIVIIVFGLRPKLRTVTNTFIVNLAVADLIAVSFCFLGNLLSNIVTPWILGWVMCKAVPYLQGVSLCASSYSLAAISFHRCKAVYRPFAVTRGLSKSQALQTIILIWIVSVLLLSPWIVTFNIVHRNDTSFCHEIWENETHFTMYFLLVNFLLCFVFPTVLIIVTNIMIWYRVGYQKLSKEVTGEVTALGQLRVQRRVRSMLGIIALSFCICWLPLYILLIRYRFGSVSETEERFMQVLLPFAQWLGSSNSSINPVIYAFLDRKFWGMLKSLRLFQKPLNLYK